MCVERAVRRERAVCASGEIVRERVTWCPRRRLPGGVHWRPGASGRAFANAYAAAGTSVVAAWGEVDGAPSDVGVSDAVLASAARLRPLVSPNTVAQEGAWFPKKWRPSKVSCKSGALRDGRASSETENGVLPRPCFSPGGRSDRRRSWRPGLRRWQATPVGPPPLVLAQVQAGDVGGVHLCLWLRVRSGSHSTSLE